MYFTTKKFENLKSGKFSTQFQSIEIIKKILEYKIKSYKSLRFLHSQKKITNLNPLTITTKAAVPDSCVQIKTTN